MVSQRLSFDNLRQIIITVAGTNGKGSTVATLEALAIEKGWSVGAFTSPHLVQFNERIRVDGQLTRDLEICQAFEAIEAARLDVPLTYFEYCTLAAMHVFRQRMPELLLLEVGMGGRLDAVNCFDADIAIVTSIDLDHCEWLGEVRSAIAREKAGILRAGKPVLCCDSDPTAGFLDIQESRGAELYLVDREFGMQGDDKVFWRTKDGSRCRRLLPQGLPVHPVYCAAALQAVELLNLPRQHSVFEKNPRVFSINNPGRRQRIRCNPELIVDVAHNPAAVTALADHLQKNPVNGYHYAVFYLLQDKPLSEIFSLMDSIIDRWFIGPVDDERAMSRQRMRSRLIDTGMDTRCRYFAHITQAYDSAMVAAQPEDRIVVFGSFHVVGAIMQHLHIQPFVSINE